MRVLWVKIGGLWPPTFGGRLRSFHLLAQLAERHEVSVVTSHAPGEDPAQLRAHLPRCEHVLSFPYAAPKNGTAGFARALGRSWLSPLPVDLRKWRIAPLRQAVGELLARGGFDLCIADFLVAMPNLPARCPVPVVFFAHNVEHMIWKRLRDTAPRWQRPLLEIEWRKMRRIEARACAGAALTIAVSETDRAQLAALAPGARVSAIPTGVDVDYFAPHGGDDAPPRLVFTGAMDWYPNEDAVLYFLDTILPSIRRDVPAASLTVVGRNPSARLRAAADAAGAHVTGTVDDVRPYIAGAAVYVVPLRVGGGTRMKIFEGLAMEKAVVSTTVGAEGLPVVPGTHFVRADQPEHFAREVVSLLRDPQRRKVLGAAGRRLVTEHYSWPRVAGEFAARCAQALG